MIVKNFSEVKEEPVEIEGGKGIKVRWLVDDAMSDNFAMRRFELKGIIPLHKHTHEHEVYILEGKGEMIDDKGNLREVKAGDFAYIPGNEVHGFKSKDKNGKMIFLCMVPKKRGKPETSFSSLK
jgi:quercetin dioxygenase-like cupin family protein